MEPHPSNLNRDDVFCLSKSWKPLIYVQKNTGNHPCKISNDELFNWAIRLLQLLELSCQRLPFIPTTLHLQPLLLHRSSYGSHWSLMPLLLLPSPISPLILVSRSGLYLNQVIHTWLTAPSVCLLLLYITLQPLRQKCQ
jgi:hypothetical protein